MSESNAAGSERAPAAGGSIEPLLPGLAACPSIFLDERGRPDFRDVYGALVSRSVDVAVAVTRVRLTTLDLSAEELDGVESLRVLVTELNALTLDAEARLIRSDPRRASRVPMFRAMLESGRLEVRSAPLGGWSPDFTVFSDLARPRAVMIGKHWFERPHPHRGPALAAVHFDDAARLAARRHGRLWERAHDVGPAVWGILSKAERTGRIVPVAAG